MATDMRRKTAYTDNRRSTQRNNVYVYGNTAKKLQAVPAEYDRPVRKVNHATKRNRERALHMNIGYVLFLASALLAVGFVLTTYLTLK